MSNDNTEVASPVLEDDLPTSITVQSTTGEQLPMIKLAEEQRDELFRLQRRLAEVEKPIYAAFGEDEFNGVDGFQALVDSGDTLVAIDGRKSDAIDSFVCVVPSVFARYYNAAVADVFVGVDSAQASAGVFRKWIDIATAHARKAGYVTVLVQTFVTNVAAFGDLRNAGFEFCAVLPTSGRVCGVGLTDSVLWRKHVADRSVSLHSHVCSAAAARGSQHVRGICELLTLNVFDFIKPINVGSLAFYCVEYICNCH